MDRLTAWQAARLNQPVVAFVALRGRVLGSVLAVQKPMQSDNPLVVLDGAGRIVGRAAGSGSNQYLIGIPAVAELLAARSSRAAWEG